MMRFSFSVNKIVSGEVSVILTYFAYLIWCQRNRTKNLKFFENFELVYFITLLSFLQRRLEIDAFLQKKKKFCLADIKIIRYLSLQSASFFFLYVH